MPSTLASTNCSTPAPWTTPRPGCSAPTCAGCSALEPLRRRISAWLAEHPDAAAELEAQRRLTHLWQATTPSEPSEATWDGVLEHLEQAPRTPAAETDHGWRLTRLACWGGA